MIVAVAGVNSERCAFQLEFGVVYSCIEDKMYTGRKGKGAFCDGEKLEVSDVKGTSRENVCPSVWLSVKETVSDVPPETRYEACVCCPSVRLSV